ncbi:MAG: RNA polymerase sigma factor [Chloroflexota bacterium]|nr:MAG: RNA polymerase sigma factor [Chloroflexota bacterium]
MQSEPDDVQVRAFQAGDVRGFDALFQRYQRPIFNYVYRMTSQLAVSEDLTQEVFLRVFSSLGRAGQVENFRAWLYRIATNVAISHLRRGEQRVTSLEDGIERQTLEEPAGDVRENPEVQHLRREDVHQVALALRHLSETHRQVLVLRQLQGLSYHEMAEVLGLSVEAVTSLLHRARREFRASMDSLSRGEILESTGEEGRA